MRPEAMKAPFKSLFIGILLILIENVLSVSIGTYQCYKKNREEHAVRINVITDEPKVLVGDCVVVSGVGTDQDPYHATFTYKADPVFSNICGATWSSGKIRWTVNVKDANETLIYSAPIECDPKEEKEFQSSRIESSLGDALNATLIGGTISLAVFSEHLPTQVTTNDVLEIGWYAYLVTTYINSEGKQVYGMSPTAIEVSPTSTFEERISLLDSFGCAISGIPFAMETSCRRTTVDEFTHQMQCGKFEIQLWPHSRMLYFRAKFIMCGEAEVICLDTCTLGRAKRDADPEIDHNNETWYYHSVLVEPYRGALVRSYELEPLPANKEDCFDVIPFILPNTILALLALLCVVVAVALFYRKRNTSSRSKKRAENHSNIYVTADTISTDGSSVILTKNVM